MTRQRGTGGAIAFGWILAAAQAASAGTFLNLDFEQSRLTGRANGWLQAGVGYEVTVDTKAAKLGNNSLRIRFLHQGTFGVGTSTFPVQDAAGKHVKYSGFIKTENVEDGWAGLWWRVDGEKGVLAFDNMADRGPKGTTPWEQYTVELDVDKEATNINFGVLMTGKGTAWFDGLRIELDGALYEQVAPVPFVPNEGQIAWIGRHAVPIETADPEAGAGDLEPLKKIIGDARIVALGEGTHGTREFFQMKDRITRFLAEQMGFTVFAIEANMPEARRVNRYVLAGEGDPKKALAGMYFWTWNTREVLDMIEWMRRFNASGKGRIEFRGFDMQFPNVAMEDVREFVERADPEYLKLLSEAYEKVKNSYDAHQADRAGTDEKVYETWHEAGRQVLDHLQANRDRYMKDFAPEEVDRAIQDARIVVQAVQALLPDEPSRDQCMARNVDWILEHTPPGTKIVLWAHNGHISKKGRYPSMGKFLHEEHGSELLVVGFAFHEGQYTAIGDQGLGTYGTLASQPGSVEWALHQSGLPGLILDLRRADVKSPDSAWLRKELDFRSIGALAVDDAFNSTVVADEFDVLIYFDQTRPSVPLRTRRPATED